MMARIKITAALIFSVLLISPVYGFSGRTHKPLPPLEITINPVSSEIVSTEIKPGQVVEFKVTAVAYSDLSQMVIQVNFAGGVSLVSGETMWKGPGIKAHEKSLIFTIRTPEKGQGKLIASVRSAPDTGVRFSAEAVYVLGPEHKEKASRNEHSVKKDRKGRDVIEYH